jgi:uncharacterized surface protein with fasciclin (FAS1) repeats
MDERSTLWWVVGIGLLLIVVFGLWWYLGEHPQLATPSDTANSTTTTQLPNAGSTVEETDGNPLTVVDRRSQTVAQVVASLADGSQYASLFGSTGIGATLVGHAPSSYTVFVSTNRGYTLLAPGTIAKMTAAEKKRMIQYSVVSGRGLDVDASFSGNVQSLSGDILNFHVGSTGLVQINSSYALETYRAKNGIVYLINQPLLPPTQAH